MTEGAPALLRRPLRYERDPEAIYAESFATVRREARLEHLPEDVAEIAVRLVHACGQPQVADRLAYSADVGAAARAAMAAGAAVLCDCEMVASGITRRLLPESVDVVSTLNDPRTPGPRRSDRQHAVGRGCRVLARSDRGIAGRHRQCADGAVPPP